MAHHNDEKNTFLSDVLAFTPIDEIAIGVGVWGLRKYYARLRYEHFPQGMISKLQELNVIDDKFNFPWAHSRHLSPQEVLRAERRKFILTHVQKNKNFNQIERGRVAEILKAREAAENNLFQWERSTISEIVSFFGSEQIAPNQVKNIFRKAKDEYMQRFADSMISSPGDTISIKSNKVYRGILLRHLKKAERVYRSEMAGISVSTRVPWAQTTDQPLPRNQSSAINPIVVTYNAKDVKQWLFKSAFEKLYPGPTTKSVKVEFQAWKDPTFRSPQGKPLQWTMRSANLDTQIHQMVEEVGNPRNGVITRGVDVIRFQDGVRGTWIETSAGTKTFLGKIIKNFGQHLGDPQSPGGRLESLTSRIVDFGEGMKAVELVIKSRHGHEMRGVIALPNNGRIRTGRNSTARFVTIGSVETDRATGRRIFKSYMDNLARGSYGLNAGNVNRIVFELDQGNVTRAQKMFKRFTRSSTDPLAMTDLEVQTKGATILVEDFGRHARKSLSAQLDKERRGVQMALDIIDRRRSAGHPGPSVFTSVDIETELSGRGASDTVWQVGAVRWEYDPATRRYTPKQHKMWYIKEGIDHVSDAALDFGTSGTMDPARARGHFRHLSVTSAKFKQEFEGWAKGDLVAHGADVAQKLSAHLGETAVRGMQDTLLLSQALYARGYSKNLTELITNRLGHSESALKEMARKDLGISASTAHDAAFDALMGGMVFERIIKDLDGNDRLVAELRHIATEKWKFLSVDEKIQLFRGTPKGLLSGSLAVHFTGMLPEAIANENLVFHPIAYGDTMSVNRSSKGFLSLRSMGSVNPWGAFNNAGRKEYQAGNALELDPSTILFHHRRRAGSAVKSPTPFVAVRDMVVRHDRNSNPLIQRFTLPTFGIITSNPRLGAGAMIFDSEFIGPKGAHIRALQPVTGMTIALGSRADAQIVLNGVHPHLGKLYRHQTDLVKLMSSNPDDHSIDSIKASLQDRAMKEHYLIRNKNQILQTSLDPSTGMVTWHGDDFIPTWVDYEDGNLFVRGVRFREGSDMVKVKIGELGTGSVVDTLPTKYMPQVLGMVGMPKGSLGGTPVDVMTSIDLGKRGMIGHMATSYGNIIAAQLLHEGRHSELQKLLSQLGLKLHTSEGKYGSAVIKEKFFAIDPNLTDHELATRLGRTFGNDMEGLKRALKKYNYVYTATDFPTPEAHEAVKTWLGTIDGIGTVPDDLVAAKFPKLAVPYKYLDMADNGVKFGAGIPIVSRASILPYLDGLGHITSENLPRTFKGELSQGYRFRARDVGKLAVHRFGQNQVGVPMLEAYLVASMHLEKGLATELINMMKAVRTAQDFGANLPKGIKTFKVQDLTWDLGKNKRSPFHHYFQKAQQVADNIAGGNARIFTWENYTGSSKEDLLNNIARDKFGMNNIDNLNDFLDQNPDLAEVVRGPGVELTPKAASEYLVSDSFFRDLKSKRIALPGTKKHIFADEMLKNPWMLELPGEVTYMGKPVASLYIPGHSQLAMWHHKPLDMRFLGEWQRSLMNLMETADAYRVDLAKNPEGAAKNLASLNRSVEKFVNLGLKEFGKNGLIGRSLTARLPVLGGVAERTIVKPGIPMLKEWKDLMSYGEAGQTMVQLAGGVTQALVPGESYITRGKAEELGLAKSFVELWGHEAGLKRYQKFLEGKEAFYAWNFVDPRLPGDYLPSHRTSKVYVNQDVSKGSITALHYVDATMMGRDFDIDTLIRLYPGNLSLYEELKNTWEAQHNPKTGWESRKFRRIFTKMNSQMEEAELQRFLSDSVTSGLVRPNRQNMKYTVLNPDTGYFQDISVKNKAGKIVFAKQKDFHEFFAGVKVEGNTPAARAARIKQIEYAITGKIGIGEVHSEMTRWTKMAELAFGIPVGETISPKSRMAPRALNKANDLLAFIKQDVISSKLMRNAVSIDSAASQTKKFLTNLKDLTPEGVKDYWSERNNPAMFMERERSATGQLIKEFGHMMEIPSLGIGHYQFTTIMGQLNKFAPDVSRLELLLDERRMKGFDETGSADEHIRAVDALLANELYQSHTGRLMSEILTGGVPTPDQHPFRGDPPKDFYMAYNRRNLRTALADRFEGPLKVYAEEGVGAGLRGGVKGVAAAVALWGAFNFFRPSQVSMLGPMPGEGGEKYDWRGGGSELPNSVPLDIPFYTWQKTVRMQPADRGAPQKMNRLFDKMNNSLQGGFFFNRPETAIYPQITGKYYDNRNRHATSLKVARDTTAGLVF